MYPLNVYSAEKGPHAFHRWLPTLHSGLNSSFDQEDVWPGAHLAYALLLYQVSHLIYLEMRVGPWAICSPGH